jgi:hypothetical protein
MYEIALEQRKEREKKALGNFSTSAEKKIMVIKTFFFFSNSLIIQMFETAG